MKKRTIFLILITFILLITGITFFIKISREKKQDADNAKTLFSTLPVLPVGTMNTNAEKIRMIHYEQTVYRILSVDLDTMTAVLEIYEPEKDMEKPDIFRDYEAIVIEVPIVHENDSYRLIHTEESSRLLNGKPFMTASGALTENGSLFERLPENFWFASGAGGWGTEITLNPDGTFTGDYHDSDMGDTGDGFPYGTIYICRFNGKFSQPEPVDDYVYLMRLEYIEADEEPDIVTYEDGVRYITSYPYGFDDGDEFLVYMPDTPVSCLPTEFMSWCESKIRLTLPSNYYGIYNINGMQGFNGRKGELPAYDANYQYTFENRDSVLRVNDSYSSSLVFWSEDGPAAISLEFYWTYNEQRAFKAQDWLMNRTGDYDLTISFNDDYSEAAVTVISAEKTDLSPWGGTADGTFTGVYQRLPKGRLR